MPQTQTSGIGLAQSIDRAAEIWAQPASRVTDAGAILLILVFCMAAAMIGAVHTRIFGHDIFTFFDAGWRVLNGQRPDIDFSPSMGPLLCLLTAAGLELARGSVNSIGYTGALVGAIAGLWGYGLVRRRMPALPAVLIALALTLIAVAPFPIGLLPNLLSHAMAYNRYGYALLGVIVVECFRPDDASLPGGISTGVISCALLFLKPSYCLVALGFAAGSLAFARPTRRRVVGMLLGASLAGFAMMAYLRFDFLAAWNDLRMMGQARGAGLSLWNIRWSFLKGLADFLPLGLLALFASVIRSEKEPIFLAAQPLFVTALFWIGGAALLATNAQPNGYPLNAVLAILLVELGRRANSAPAIAPRFLKAETILVLLGLSSCILILAGNASGLAYALFDKGRTPPDSVLRFDAPRLSSLFFYDVPDGSDADQRSNGRVYVAYVNDGLNLIRRVSPERETIFTLDMVNPFSYGLLRRPPRGGTPTLAFNNTFSDQHKPSPEWLFGSADVVMVPKHPASAETLARAMFRNYLGGIQAGFRLCAESDWWQLYKRPGNLQGCSAVSAR
ncbi:MAG TPA: hypothetical protein VEV17_15250 [Bryobacteraceae bacterium]|nr:hypothetical protein [Bryobacteraceae bacterium]